MKQLVIIMVIVLFYLFPTHGQNIGIGTTLPTHQLHTTQEVRHEKLMGQGVRPLMVDSLGVLRTNLFHITNTAINATPMTIPEYSCIGITSHITISGWPVNVDPRFINLEINIDHPYTYDLVAFLVSPFNDTLLLVNKNGLGANFTQTRFSDNSLNVISTATNPFSQEYQTNGRTGQLNPLCYVQRANISKFGEIGGGTSINPNGQWTLVVRDLDYYTTFIGPPALPDIGTLVSWKIIMNEPISPDLLESNDKYAKWKSGTLTYSSSVNDDKSNLLLTPANNVGIGVTQPQHKLSIGSNTSDSQVVSLRSYSNATDYWKGGAAFGYNNASVIMGENDGVAQIGGHNATLSAWTPLGINVGGGNVGIGTASPTEKLQIMGTTKTTDLVLTNNFMANGFSLLSGIKTEISNTLRISSGNPGDNKILTSDGIGNASWQNEKDPKIASIGLGYIPKWNGSKLVDGIIIDDGLTGIVNGEIKITGGSPGAGRVLTCINAQGNASWQPLPPLLEFDPQVGPNSLNYISKWDGSSLTNSLIVDNGTTIGINQLPDPKNQFYVFKVQPTSLGDGQATIQGRRNRDSQNDGTSYAPENTNCAVFGNNYWGDVYSFGVTGSSYNDFTRTGGVLGAEVSGLIWGSLGYRSSSTVPYGVYGNSAYATGGGYLPTTESTGIGGGFFGVIGSLSKGSVIGQMNEGELFAAYNKGDVYTSGKNVELVTTAEKVIPGYAVTSTELKIYGSGKIQLTNGSATVVFDENYASLLGDTPIVTASAMGECNGVYISGVTKNGFVIKELNKGQSTVEISWIAVGSRIDANNALVPSMLTNLTFDRNVSKALFSDGDINHSGLGMWWDGKEIKFGDLPASLIQTREQKIKIMEGEKNAINK